MFIDMHTPYVYVYHNGILSAIPTFVLTTLLTCFLLTFIPSMVPLWSACATNSWV